jgi:hypothetical protein
MPKIAALAACALALALVPACFTAKQEVRLATLEEQGKRTAAALDELGGQLSTLIAELANKERIEAREKYCKSAKITEFLDEVQAGLQSACSPISMASSLPILDKLPTAIAHLDPQAGLKSLRRTRIGQIRNILGPENIHASTRILVMARPLEDTEAGRGRALALAKEIINEIVKKELKDLPKPPPRPPGAPAPGLTQREVPILPPYLLPCELSQNIETLYRKALYRPLPNEPQIGKPDVMIFLFVSAC